MSNTVYIVGRPFPSQFGKHATGDELSEETVSVWPYLESMVNTGLLYRVMDGEGYDRLPPHVSSAMRSRQEVSDILDLQPAEKPWDKPQALVEAQDQLEVEIRSRVDQGLLASEYKERQQAAVERVRDVSKPVEKFLPNKPPAVDTMKSEAEENGTDFDPDSIRTMKLPALRTLAKENGIDGSGAKPVLAQRVIDHFIETKGER